MSETQSITKKLTILDGFLRYSLKFMPIPQDFITYQKLLD